MKFKKDAINPGMVIHCPTEKDARALCRHLKDIGYVNVDYMVEKYSKYGELTCYKMCRTNDGGLTSEYSPISYYRDRCHYEITEFSDLIEPDENLANPKTEMSAVEVLKWLQKYDGKPEMKKVLGRTFCNGAMDLDADEIVRKITAYEAAKKAPKPVEVEEGYRCYVFVGKQTAYTAETEEYELWNVTEDEAKGNVKAKAMEKTRETGKPTSTEVVFICRVKENK